MGEVSCRWDDETWVDRVGTTQLAAISQWQSLSLGSDVLSVYPTKVVMGRYCGLLDVEEEMMRKREERKEKQKAGDQAARLYFKDRGALQASVRVRVC